MTWCSLLPDQHQYLNLLPGNLKQIVAWRRGGFPSFLVSVLPPRRPSIQLHSKERKCVLVLCLCSAVLAQLHLARSAGPAQGVSRMSTDILDTPIFLADLSAPYPVNVLSGLWHLLPLSSFALVDDTVLSRHGVCGRWRCILLRYQCHHSQRHHCAHLQAPICRSALFRKFVWHWGKESLCWLKHSLFGLRENHLENNFTS